ncbi:MAG: hypothetical protein LHW56_07640 [Candidatus Cloacimonetes bacterium]|jgi:hypothetical protein|nr:hypothetical protein [Candidatus Cloacimonadota bacterium]MDY0172767.1 hypothetical protein [Candidatus Cloacimonadaceae bacterium]MDY0326311.1 hypothetical protein [Candidatus Cloacimonadaceae bacterium]
MKVKTVLRMVLLSAIYPRSNDPGTFGLKPQNNSLLVQYLLLPRLSYPI